MAGKANKTLVSIISNLTAAQAADMSAGLQKMKSKIAPNSRGTIGVSLAENVGRFLAKGVLKIGQGKK
jgi:hypothetical protein